MKNGAGVGEKGEDRKSLIQMCPKQFFGEKISLLQTSQVDSVISNKKTFSYFLL